MEFAWRRADLLGLWLDWLSRKWWKSDGGIYLNDLFAWRDLGGGARGRYVSLSSWLLLWCRLDGVLWSRFINFFIFFDVIVFEFEVGFHLFSQGLNLAELASE